MDSFGRLPDELRLEVLKRTRSLSNTHRMRMARRDWWQMPVPAGTQAALQALQRLLTYQVSFGSWCNRPVVTVTAADGRVWKIRQQSAFVQVSPGAGSSDGSNSNSNGKSSSGSSGSSGSDDGRGRTRNFRDIRQTLDYFANTGFTAPIVGFQLGDDTDEVDPEDHPMDVALGGPDLLQPEYEQYPDRAAASPALRRLAQLLSFVQYESLHVTVTYVDETDTDICQPGPRFQLIDTHNGTERFMEEDDVLSLMAQRPIATMSLGGQYDGSEYDCMFYIRFKAPAFANPW